MIPFQIRPDEILHEVNEFYVKFSHGIDTLSKIGDIEVGVSEKEEIYQEDKMVLYRFTPRVKKRKDAYLAEKVVRLCSERTEKNFL